MGKKRIVLSSKILFTYGHYQPDGRINFSRNWWQILQAFRVCYEKKKSQPKHIVVGTQKNRLNETVLLSTPKIWVRKYLQFYAQKFCLSKPVN